MKRRCFKCNTIFPGEMAFCGNDGSVLVLELPADQQDSRLGSQLGDYVLAAPVADGATGRVYEGRNAHTRQKVAVKVLHEDVTRDRIAVERFKRESEAGSSMTHPHIVKVLDSGQTPQGWRFMTMEFLTGEELGDVFRRKEKMSPERIIRVISQMALALDYAHSFGYIHRDLKPDNIFLCRSAEGDVVKLLDFGSVKMQMQTGPKLTAIGTTLGSPFYMSPEQAMGKQDIDQRSDVFATGSILYEMLTGQVAFGANNIAEVLMKILQQQPTPPSMVVDSCPRSIDDVLDRALAKDKTNRYASVLELVRALIQAYGLSGDVQKWANTPLTEIAEALRDAKPAAPQLEGPVTRDATRAKFKLATEPEFDQEWLTGSFSQKRLPWLGLLAGALVVFAALGALALWLIR